MISFPFWRPSSSATIEAVYGMIVAQARSPEFYRGYGVPDTVTGRFDMIVLHVVLVLRRLRGLSASANLPPLGQQIFDRFCQDMDDNFREMGVGDLAVPKEMKRVAEAFYGRAAVYEAALGDDDGAGLARALARNVYDTAEPGPGAHRLSDYMKEAEQELAKQDPGAGQVRFPDPKAFIGVPGGV
jgi:cytochrome b pre-mRNA-processing protein 3